MELQKGICLVCGKTKVIHSSHFQEACKIICLLFPQEILNPSEFNKVESSLKLCPICYHKLIILKHTNERTKSTVVKGASINSCFLCESENKLFHINHWPSFNAMADDAALPKNNKCVACSDCLFYLDTKVEIKAKLFSKYPQLKTKKHANKQKWKVKLLPKKKLHLPGKHKSKPSANKTTAEIISISSDEESPMRKHIKFDLVKKFRPLKDHKSYKDNDVVKIDSKFSNQIPYVLINMTSFPNTPNDFFGYKTTKLKKNNVKALSKLNYESSPVPVKENTNFNTNNKINEIDTSVETRNEVMKYDVRKKLVVNVSKMNIEKYVYKNETNQENSNDNNSAVLQNLNLIGDNISTENSNNATDSQNNSLEQADTSFEIKNKRKSVSFAEDKNVEIEYFESDSDVSITNLDGDLTESIIKIQNKGILKYDENVTLNKVENNELSEELMEVENDEQNNSITTDDTNITSKKKKLKNRRNTTTSTIEGGGDISSGSDNEILFEKSKCKELSKEENGLTDATEGDISDKVPITSDDVEDNSKNESKEKSETESLSRGEMQSTVVEDISDDDNISAGEIQCLSNSTKQVHSEDISETIENENEDVNRKNTKKSRPKPLSKKKQQNTYIENVSDDDDNTNINLTNDENVSNEKKLESSNSENVSGHSVEAENERTDENIIDLENDKYNATTEELADELLESKEADDKQLQSKKVKRERPKPLSKKKKSKLDRQAAAIPETTDKTIANLSDSNQDKAHQEDSPKQSIDSDNLDKLHNEIQTGDSETKENSSLEEEINSTDSTVQCQTSNVSTENMLTSCDEVLNKSDIDEKSKKDNTSNSPNTDICNKSNLVPDNEVELVDDIDQSNNTESSSSSINTEEREDIVKEGNLIDENKGSDEKLNEKVDTTSIDSFDKNDEVGISEVDKDNINSILSHIFPEESDEEKELLDDSKNENDSSDDSNRGIKRKRSSEELNLSKEKKKKKVTFCDEIS